MASIADVLTDIVDLVRPLAREESTLTKLYGDIADIRENFPADIQELVRATVKESK